MQLPSIIQASIMVRQKPWVFVQEVQDEILVAAEFPADFEKQYMRVGSRVRTFPPLTPNPMASQGRHDLVSP